MAFANFFRSMRAVVWCAAATAGCQSPGRAPLAEPISAEPRPAAAVGTGEPSTGGRTPSALVELFTSEGCSSCPAADENLARLTEHATNGHQRVFTLELHVDYWNYLGWVDPFSDEQHSLRQGAYASQLGSHGIYTPQMVVNGREELVGSNAAGARAAIDRALDTPAIASVAVQAHRSGAAIEVDYRVTSPHAVSLQLAVASDLAETHVTRGENANQLLRHRHVVRAFRTVAVPATANGSWKAEWPAAKVGEPLFVVAYAADPKTLQVLGADATTLPATN